MNCWETHFNRKKSKSRREMGIKETTTSTDIYLISVMRRRQTLGRKSVSGKDVARISYFRTSG